MEQPLSSAVDPHLAISSDVTAYVRLSIARWGLGLGGLVGALIGTVIGLLLSSLGGTMIALGFGAGILLGLILGGAIALVEGFALVRLLPAVLSGKSDPSRVAFTTAAVAIVAVFGLALLLLNMVWHGVLGVSWVMLPSLVLAGVTWFTCALAGNHILTSILGTFPKSPIPGSPVAPGSAG